MPKNEQHAIAKIAKLYKNTLSSSQAFWQHHLQNMHNEGQLPTLSCVQ
jgi:hypothetical protein